MVKLLQTVFRAFVTVALVHSVTSKHTFSLQNVTIKWVCHVTLVSRLVLVFQTAPDFTVR